MSSSQRRTTSTSTSVATPIPRLTPPQSQGYTEVAKSVFDRIRHGVRRSSSHTTPPDPSKSLGPRRYVPTSRQDASFKAIGIKIRALDINQAKTHVVLAGGKILKTLRIDDNHDTPNCVEDFNLREAAVSVPWNSNAERASDAKASAQHDAVDPAALKRETFDIEDVAWSNNEFKDSIATAARNGKIMLYNIERPGMEIARLHEHLQQVHKVDFNPLEGGVLLSGSQDGTVRLWDLRSLQRSAMLCSSRDTYHGRSQVVRHVKWSPTSTWTFAFSTDNGGIQRWDTRNNRTPLLKVIAHDGHCNTIDWHPDGRHLASGGEDGYIKVWNMAPDDSRAKAIITMRAPHGVQNVRWRPSCFAPEPSEAGLKHCTHLATSYKSYPVVHVWDLRRPYIPFREIHHTHNSGTTDMLWRTRELLWTVGPEGEFMQTDVQFATKTLDRRPTSTFARSCTGEVDLFIMKRHHHHGPTNELGSRIVQQDHATKSQAPLSQELLLGRSPGDDSLDEKFLGTSNRRRRSRTPSFKSYKSAGTTPPSIEDTTKSDTVDFTLVMHDHPNFKPSQTPKIGPSPGMESGLITTYMAQKCKGPPTDLSLDLNYVMNIRTVFDQNAAYAQRASRYREAQTWRIMGAQITKDLYDRAEENRRNRIKSKHNMGEPVITASKSSSPQDVLSPFPTRGNRHARAEPIAEATAKPHTLKVMESTSNMPTPLAVPVQQNEGHTSKVEQPIADVTGDLELPPLLIKPRHLDYTANSASVDDSSCSEEGLSSSSVEENQSQGEKHDAHSPHFDRQISSDSVAIFSMSTDSEPKASETSSIISQNSKSFLSDIQASPELEADDPHNFHGHRASNLNNLESRYSDGDSRQHVYAAEHEDSATFNKLHDSTSQAGKREASDFEDSEVNTQEMVHENGGNHSRWSGEEESVLNFAHEHGKPEVMKGARPRLAYFEFTSLTSPLFLPNVPPIDDLEYEEDFVLEDFMTTLPPSIENGPLELTASKMVQELVTWYVEHGDVRMASQLFQLTASVLAPPLPASSETQMLPDDHAANAFYDHLTGNILNMAPAEASRIIRLYHGAVKAMDLEPGFVEAFLSHYHEELLAHNLWNAAAMLRKACYPAFPSVYEQALIDTDIGFLCLECHNPINNNANRMWCETCDIRQDPCCICDSYTSPYEPYFGKEKSKVMESPPAGFPTTGWSATVPASLVWACCPVCNHSTHIACASVWFTELDSQGACPTDGCLCECFRGGFREEKVVVVEEKKKKERTVRFLDGSAE